VTEEIILNGFIVGIETQLSVSGARVLIGVIDHKNEDGVGV